MVKFLLANSNLNMSLKLFFCPKRSNTNKSPTKLNAAENNLTQVICLPMRKTTETKPHQVNLRSPFPRIHYYQNKRLQVKGISIPNTNL